MKIDFTKNSLAMHIVCMAVGENSRLLDKFDYTRNGEHEVVFTVDGVELDFTNVIKYIDEMFEQAVKEEAGKMYLEKFDNNSEKIANELMLIGERLKEIRCETFPDVDWHSV
jgi:hypothetical protein